MGNMRLAELWRSNGTLHRIEQEFDVTIVCAKGILSIDSEHVENVKKADLMIQSMLAKDQTKLRTMDFMPQPDEWIIVALEDEWEIFQFLFADEEHKVWCGHLADQDSSHRK